MNKSNENPSSLENFFEGRIWKFGLPIFVWTIMFMIGGWTFVILAGVCILLLLLAYFVSNKVVSKLFGWILKLLPIKIRDWIAFILSIYGAFLVLGLLGTFASKTGLINVVAPV